MPHTKSLITNELSLVAIKFGFLSIIFHFDGATIFLNTAATKAEACVTGVSDQGQTQSSGDWREAIPQNFVIQKNKRLGQRFI